jgi:DNA-binding response OmpR family regulator
MKLLLIEDDEAIIAVLSHSLRIHHSIVDTVTDAEAGWTYATTYDYDLIVLDIILPQMDGIQFCQKFREEGYTTPILLLTAQDSPFDKVRGLDAGADDYVVKPFNIDELSARIRALLRRGKASPFPLLMWEDLALNPSTFEVIYQGKPLVLTIKEYELLELFLRDCRHVFSSDEILDKLWSSEEFPVESTVRSHVRRLRNKLVAAGAPHDFISTIYGRGYYLKPSFPDPRAENEVIASASEDSAQLAQTDVVVAGIDPTQDASLLCFFALNTPAPHVLLNAIQSIGLRIATASLALTCSELLPNPTLDKTKQPDIILIQLPADFSEDAFLTPYWEFLQKLRQFHPDSPILLVGRQLDLEERLELNQIQGKVLLESSLNPEIITKAVRYLLGWRERDIKVMVVDDDFTWLQTIPSLLTPLGFNVSTLAEPKQFWTALELVKPDVLILDVDMPSINGIELCQILRSDLRWRHLPILFLSASRDTDTQQKAFSIGADDYLLKPVNGRELAHRIRHRLQRMSPLAM